MFEFIRTHQRLMQLLLLILIFPSFALIGISGYQNYVSGDEDLAKVGTTSISSKDFESAQANQMQQLQARMGPSFDPAVFDNAQARKALLESLIDRVVIIETAKNEHFSVSDGALREAIASIPELQVDGHFSPERYNQVLASMGVTSRDFEQGQRSELALQRVLQPVDMSVQVPQPVVDGLLKALTAERTVRLQVFDAKNYAKDIKVSDSDIKDWYEQNQEKLRVPEYVNAKYLVLDEKAAMSNVPPVTEQQMRDFYKQNKSRYVRPARVELSHILIQSSPSDDAQQREAARKKAQAIADKVKADTGSFAEVAKTQSQDAGSSREGGKLGWISKGMLPEQLEQAVFALKKGQVSDVVEGPQGFHVFLATNVEPETGESFDEARSKVEAEIRRQLGAERFADMASKLRDLVYENADSLGPAAQALGLKVRTAEGIARDRLLPKPQVGENAASAGADAQMLGDARVRRDLFSSAVLTDKQNSGVIEISPDTLVVVRVDKKVDSHIQPLDQVKQIITDNLVRERSVQAAKKAGEAALAGYTKADAKAVPNGFGDPLTISRINPQNVGPQALQAAFKPSVNALPAYQGVEGGSGYVVIRVESAGSGKVDDKLLAGFRQQLTRMWAQAEQEAVLRTLRENAKVKMLPKAEQIIQGEDKAKG